jgi:hypothetical protein
VCVCVHVCVQRVSASAQDLTNEGLKGDGIDSGWVVGANRGGIGKVGANSGKELERWWGLIEGKSWKWTDRSHGPGREAGAAPPATLPPDAAVDFLFQRGVFAPNGAPGRIWWWGT